MNRTFHPYWDWEEHKCGMWKMVHGAERKRLVTLAVAFTGNARAYGKYMLRVLDEWPVSCEHNLTAQNMNRQAWIGHAACCIAIECPEDVTREAWHYLSKQQQDEANAVADIAIAKWESCYTEKPAIDLQLLLFGGGYA